ncbi:MAG: BREX-3 system phosphatase PglZ [Deltaproteobacteria bacterium]|nr:BREX-3 system phosphatase PglZ [Deltaproteobacteria bacterium]
MSSWRDQILKEFTPKVSRLTLVADPDGLLLEEKILEGIREQGFELIPFEDHVAFRYAYESKFRSRWDRGEGTDLVVVLRSQAGDLGSLPYDLLQAGRRLSFNLGDIFPNLSYPVLAALDRGDLDILYEAQKRHTPGQLGDNATKEFVLRHLFEIAPELIKQPADLLRVLLQRHYRGLRIPAILDERFIQLLRQDNTFEGWPIETLISDREAFFTFLQERWPIFLNSKVTKEETGAQEDEKPYGLAIKGPVDLPFDHHDIRVYMDNLFLEGLLHSVSHDHADVFTKTWVRIGIRTDPSEDRSRRLNMLIENLQASIPAEDARHGDWLHFARGWAELSLQIHEQVNDANETAPQSLKCLQTKVDAVFASWLARRYAGLVNLPPVPPVMLHHIPRFLSRQVGENWNCKMALLVVDGLSFDQWLVMREGLVSRRPHLIFRENAVFAWIPTITSVSRQAVFAGRPPFFFPNSIQITDKESALWIQFWADQGLSQNQVVYVRGLGDGDLNSVEEVLSHPQIRVAGLVIDKVDKIMHGMELGAAGMHNQVRQWAQQPYMVALLDLLLDRHFCVFLTSDHGNIEAEGCGRPAEGVVADLRGERVRVYSDALLRNKVQDRFPSAIKWPPVGLPEDYLPLIAPSRLAFVREGEQIVSHGGLSIEELIVPLIQIERRDT